MILITGCETTAARSLINELLSKNYKLRCHAIEPLKDIPEGCDLISGMLESDREIKRALIGIKTIIHFLEIPESGNKGRNYMKQINIELPQRLLTAAAASGVEHAIIRSTWQVYGETDKSPADENRPMRPKSPFGKDRRSLEIFCSSPKLFPMKITIFRPAFIMGPETDNPAALLLLYLALAQESENRTNIINSGKNIFEFLGYSDLAKAVSAAVEKKPAGVFNLSGGGTPSTSELMNILKKTKPELKIFNFSFIKAKYLSIFLGIVKSHHLTGEHMMMLTRNMALDSTAAKNILGWIPELDTKAVFSETIKWYSQVRMQARILK